MGSLSQLLEGKDQAFNGMKGFADNVGICAPQPLLNFEKRFRSGMSWDISSSIRWHRNPHQFSTRPSYKGCCGRNSGLPVWQHAFQKAPVAPVILNKRVSCFPFADPNRWDGHISDIKARAAQRWTWPRSLTMATRSTWSVICHVFFRARVVWLIQVLLSEGFRCWKTGNVCREPSGQQLAPRMLRVFWESVLSSFAETLV